MWWQKRMSALVKFIQGYIAVQLGQKYKIKQNQPVISNRTKSILNLHQSDTTAFFFFVLLPRNDPVLVQATCQSPLDAAPVPLHFGCILAWPAHISSVKFTVRDWDYSPQITPTLFLKLCVVPINHKKVKVGIFRSFLKGDATNVTR